MGLDGGDLVESVIPFLQTGIYIGHTLCIRAVVYDSLGWLFTIHMEQGLEASCLLHQLKPMALHRTKA